ncbi:hypothetical protein EJP82_26525 [Paenibacillus anaericanus]|uniref:Sigma factor regulator C-terminal domain-containing protein n=1 Tax=Paenibacillus anaericanus TaxID=170367 RepID=A0A3S1BGY5_9BACL|nr:anti-sigma factor [Paenibacillus anaericanus]RUT39252.1 hypothetical protein EJP82_26525 [Paenibacillus anaericanus]
MSAPWEDQDDKSLSKVIKRAKRRTTIRNIIISLIVAIVVLFVGAIVNVQLISRSSSQLMNDEYTLKRISGPNQYISGITGESGFLSGRVEINMYKVVEGVPIPWQTKKTVYNVVPFLSFTNVGGNTQGLNIPLPDPKMVQEKFEYYRNYNGYNGQRNMAYYIPGVNYNDKILNDLPTLEQMDQDKLVEMAISFDKEYSLAEVRAMIPAELTQVWYWVDTYDNKKYYEPFEDGNGNMSYAVPEGDNYLFGFGINLDGPEVNEQNFIDALGQGLEGRYQYEFNRINNYLKGDKAKPDKSDIRILGVVLTGNAKELQILSGQPYVRGAVLGAVTDKY